MVGIALSFGVTWVMLPIKFMFFWNMVGALGLIPALLHFLLNGIGRARPVASPA